MRPQSGKTIEPEQDQRRHPRQRVSWLVTIATGSRQYQGRTKDVSASGAKILLKERPPLGTEVGLCFRPPGRRPVETRALVWRLDGEGLACMFVGTQGADFLAAVTPRRESTPATPQRAPVGGIVLLVASEPELRAFAQDALTRAGYTVLDAGPQPLLALRMAEEHRGAITLALVAAELRLMNGDLLAKRLAPMLPSAKLLLMSSRSAPSPAGDGALWLPTPCTDGELLARVQQALVA